jgi:hypothetical protein
MVEDLCAALDELIAWATDIKEVMCRAEEGAMIVVVGRTPPAEGETPRYYENCPPPESSTSRPAKKRARKKAPARPPRPKRA